MADEDTSSYGDEKWWKKLRESSNPEQSSFGAPSHYRCPSDQPGKYCGNCAFRTDKGLCTAYNFFCEAGCLCDSWTPKQQQETFQEEEQQPMDMGRPPDEAVLGEHRPFQG